MKKIFSILLSFCNQHIWVTFYSWRANKIIWRQIQELEAKEFNVNLFANKFEDAKKTVEEFHQEHLERKKILEEKARSLLLIVTASATLTTGILTFVYNLEGQHLLLLTTLILGYLFLILCIIDILATLNTTPYYYISDRDYFRTSENSTDLEYDNINNKISYIELLYRNSQLNSKKNLIKQNQLYAGFQNLRNGVLLICIFFMLSIVQKMAGQETPVPNNCSSGNCHIRAGINDSTTLGNTNFPLEHYGIVELIPQVEN